MAQKHVVIMHGRKTKCPSRACFCAMLTVWQFVCIIALTVCSVLFLKPYIRTSRYTITKCKVENTFYTSQFVCSCGYSCESLYPCLLVHVSFNTSSRGDMHTTALYSDDLHQARVYEDKYDGQQACSLHVCQSDEHVNRAAVRKFERDFGTRGRTFSCFYDPNSSEWGAVININMPRMRVLHAMVWPTIAFSLGSLTCIIFCKRCRKYTLKEQKKEKSTSDDAEEKVQLQEVVGVTPAPPAVLPICRQGGATIGSRMANAKSTKGSPESKDKQKDKKSFKKLSAKVTEGATKTEKKPWL